MAGVGCLSLRCFRVLFLPVPWPVRRNHTDRPPLPARRLFTGFYAISGSGSEYMVKTYLKKIHAFFIRSFFFAVAPRSSIPPPRSDTSDVEKIIVIYNNYFTLLFDFWPPTPMTMESAMGATVYIEESLNKHPSIRRRFPWKSAPFVGLRLGRGREIKKWDRLPCQ